MTQELVDTSMPQHQCSIIVDQDVPLEFERRLKLLSEQLAQFSQQFVSLGDACAALIDSEEEQTESDLLFAHVVNYIWTERAKSTLLLWRDVLLEQQKAILLKNDLRVSDKDLELLWQESMTIQRVAWASLEQTLDKELGKRQKNAQKALKKWKLQANPWEIYKEQFLTIAEQGKELESTYPKLLNVQKKWTKVTDLVNKTVEECADEIEAIEGFANQAIDMIQGLEGDELKKELARLAPRLKSLEEEVRFANYLNAFTEKLEKLLAGLPKQLTIVLESDGGFLQQRSTMLKKRAHQWLESEIYPLLYEVWELAEGSCNGFKMILINIRNRINIILKENLNDLSKDELNLAKPLLAFLKDTQTTRKNFDQVRLTILERLDHEFKLSYIYDSQKEFLPVSLQSSLNQRFWMGRDGWLANVQSWFGRQWERLQNFRAKMQREQQLGVAEKVVRCISNRKPDPQNMHYTNIFTTKGYIGEAFLVGREEQLTHVEKLVQSWEKGYRGSILLTGERLSGKTLFAEIVAHRYFPDNFIRLKPDSSLTVQGHKTTIGYDLSEALRFIQKHTLHTRPMLWIDDLETWWNPKVPFYQNIEALNRWVDRYATRVFVVVSTNNLLKKDLQHFYNIDRVFQATLSMDKIGQEAMKQAIWIRHGATHKKLVNDKGEVLQPNTVQRLVKKIYRASSGNIGEALNIWVNSTYYINEDHVRNRFEQYISLPHFLNAETALLLLVILKYKRTNEYNLRKLFGPAFGKQHATVLRRLMSMGLVRRQLDGWLGIEELIVNDLKEQLEHYKQWKHS